MPNPTPKPPIVVMEETGFSVTWNTGGGVTAEKGGNCSRSSELNETPDGLVAPSATIGGSVALVALPPGNGS